MLNMFKVNNKNIIKTSMTSFWCFIVKFEQISCLFPMFLLLTLNKYMFAGWKMRELSQYTKPKGFFMFSGGTEKQYWAIMD